MDDVILKVSVVKPERGPRQMSNSFAASFPPALSGFSSSLVTSTPKALGYGYHYQGSHLLNSGQGLTNSMIGESGPLALEQSPGVVSLLSDRLEAQARVRPLCF